MRFSSFATGLVLAASFAATSVPAAIAQAAPVAVSAQQALPSGNFIKKSKKLQGGWEVIQRDGNTYIKFADNFRASNGPDLKVFLSPTSVAAVNGKTAVNGSVLLGKLSKTRGAQEYLVPAGVNIADFESVLVHCEEFSVLWGGGNL